MFNSKVAADLYDEICKMDDDTAESFMRCLTYDLLQEDLANNHRTVYSHADEIIKEIRDEVAKSLMLRGDDPAVLQACEIIGEIAKDDDHWKNQVRDNTGRWTRTSSITFTRTKSKEPKQQSGRFRSDGSQGFDVTSALGRAGEETSRFQEKWNRSGDNGSTNAQTYRRIEAGAAALGQIGGPKAKAAATVGEFVGRYGPEAEKVIGPHLRRTAYRYRGTERKLDSDLARQQREQASALTNGKVSAITPETRMEASQRAAVNYLNTRLPQQRLSGLQSAAGKIPPSEGVIINADGKIITQAVGYSDDHYLPFNLKNLKGLQGGTYVRSRSAGGPTTEDIYAGLVSGARSVTVVSRSGVFTIDFDDDFRGGRRYNDKAAQMVGRYAKTLDAVKSEQVSRRGVTPEEKAMIRDEVETELGDWADRNTIESTIKERITEYRTNPTLSKDELEEIDLRSKKDNPEPAKQRIVRAALIDAAMEQKAARQYKLDGEGYGAALDALKEQFPYYIAQVNYRHRGNTDYDNRFSGESDRGYVKPRYNRPEGAKEGFFDPSVTGRGKISADRTNFQNWSNNPDRKDSGTSEVHAVPGASRPENPAKRVQAAMTNANIKQGQKSALQDIVQYYGSRVEEKEYPALAAAVKSNNWDDLMSNPAQLQKVEAELEQVHRVVGSSDNDTTKGLHQQGEAKLARYRAAKSITSGSKYSRETRDLGQSPEEPYMFDDSPAYKPGSDPGLYDTEMKKLASRAELPDATNADDATLRDAAAFYGLVADQAARKARDPNHDVSTVLESLASRSRGNQQMLNQAYQRLERHPNPAALSEMFTNRAEAVERIRRIKVAQQHAATPKKVESGPTKVTYDSGSDLHTKVRGWAEQLTKHDSIDAPAAHFMAQAIKSGNFDDVKEAFEELTEQGKHMVRSHLRDNGINV